VEYETYDSKSRKQVIRLTFEIHSLLHKEFKVYCATNKIAMKVLLTRAILKLLKEEAPITNKEANQESL
jgi:hypothetical protein